MNWVVWWHQADFLVRGVFLLLLAMSLLSWSVALYKYAQYRREAAREEALAADLAQGRLPAIAPDWLNPDFTDRPALEARAAQALRERRLELEGGLTWLASIGNAAPFIGLLGTVWGIMHALQGLQGMTALSMDMIAGPVSEALVATAAGLFTAIPAVMAYNLLVRRLRRLGGRMDGNRLRQVELALAARRAEGRPC